MGATDGNGTVISFAFQTGFRARKPVPVRAWKCVPVGAWERVLVRAWAHVNLGVQSATAANASLTSGLSQWVGGAGSGGSGTIEVTALSEERVPGTFTFELVAFEDDHPRHPKRDEWGVRVQVLRGCPHSRGRSPRATTNSPGIR